VFGNDRDRETFGEFAAAALPALLRFGHVLTGSPQEGADLVQDALARCRRRWRWVRADDPRAYVRRVMVNARLSWWRRGSRARLGEAPGTATGGSGIRCGGQTAADTWMVVAGQRNEPGSQAEFLLLTRHDHVLLWNLL
jgi:DNA-directed RNA polymerase specialized sigma24 family protein